MLDRGALQGCPAEVLCRAACSNLVSFHLWCYLTGVDETDSYEALCTFIKTVSEQSSVSHFIMHCRKCMLSGLNPAQNRTIPPLRYIHVSSMPVSRYPTC